MGFRWIWIGLGILFSLGCASGFMKYEEDIDQLEMNKEFKKLVKVESKKNPSMPEGQSQVPEQVELSASELQVKKKLEPETSENRPAAGAEASEDSKVGSNELQASKKGKSMETSKGSKESVKADEKKDKAVEKGKAKVEVKSGKATLKKKADSRWPELEDAEGFEGRRPIVDPMTVGEKVTLGLSYFAAPAGRLTMEVAPFVDVNKRKSYHFVIRAKSSRLFSMFYAVDDWAETYMDYETLRPSTYGIHVKESKQLREIKSYFDWKTLTAKYWDTKITKDKGEQNKKLDWKIEDFSQNVISALFYMRMFQLKVGKKLAFRVADAGKNLVFSAEVLRKEKLSTAIGELDTVVVKPKVTIGGAFKPMGDILMWLTDDDRKLLVKIEAKIKIGTVLGTLEKVELPKR